MSLNSGSYEERADDGLRGLTVVLDTKSLLTESLVYALEAVDGTLRFEYDTAIADRLTDPDVPSPALVIVCPRCDDEGANAIAARVNILQSLRPELRFAVLSHLEDSGSVLAALALGAQGYIPTTLPLRVTIQALRVIVAGGIFVPSASLPSVSSGETTTIRKSDVPEGLLSAREHLVARALRKGTPNKTIAYDLGIAESTVKLLVRSVMRKLKARNRTEIAYLTNSLFGPNYDEPE